jgi:hypothetical protein
MLLLDSPRRFSTDIDIVVAPGTDMDAVLEDASRIWPFVQVKEQERKSSADIEKRHFKFSYTSPLSGKDQTAILDVLFEDDPYPTITKRKIANELLVTSEPYTEVSIPSPNCIIADKLTAFAPHTTGIPFGKNKDLEIIKQLYDVASLVNLVDDFHDVKETYARIVQSEIGYRKLSVSAAAVLEDTIDTALCIAGRGTIDPAEYAMLRDAITNIRGHIFAETFTGETAVTSACMVIYLAAAILTAQVVLPTIKEDAAYTNVMIQNEKFKSLNHLRKTFFTGYKYLYEAAAMLNG